MLPSSAATIIKSLLPGLLLWFSSAVVSPSCLSADWLHDSHVEGCWKFPPKWTKPESEHRPVLLLRLKCLDQTEFPSSNAHTLLPEVRYRPSDERTLLTSSPQPITIHPPAAAAAAQRHTMQTNAILGPGTEVTASVAAEPRTGGVIEIAGEKRSEARDNQSHTFLPAVQLYPAASAAFLNSNYGQRSSAGQGPVNSSYHISSAATGGERSEKKRTELKDGV